MARWCFFLLFMTWFVTEKYYFLALFFVEYIYRTVYILFMAQESTKNQILEISTALFAEKGYDAVGVQEIVDKSGITKPTLYYYFGSKKGLLEFIVREKETEHLSVLYQHITVSV